MPTPPPTPGWYDDPDGRRRWWDGQRWGAYAPWDDHGSPERPAEQRQPRPKLDGSLTFDPTASGRIARAQGSPTPPDSAASDAADAGAAGSADPPAPGAGSRGPRTPQPGGIVRWETPAAQPRQERPAKRMGTAYLILVVLGLLGGHRFYLGRVPSATVQMMLSFAAAAAVVVQTGDSAAPLWLLVVPAAAAIWWISDLFRTSAMVHEFNRRAAKRATQHPGAPGYDRGWPDP